jgi:hypothetical protein
VRRAVKRYTVWLEFLIAPGILPGCVWSVPTVCVIVPEGALPEWDLPLQGYCVSMGGTRQRHFTGINLKPHKLPENAPSPTGQVHLGMMAGNHFPRENALQASQRMCEKCRFSENNMHFRQLLGAVLRTHCLAA